MKVTSCFIMVLGLAMVDIAASSYKYENVESDEYEVDPCEVQVDVFEFEFEPRSRSQSQKVVDFDFEFAKPRSRPQKVVESRTQPRLEILEFLKASQSKYSSSAALRVPPYSEAEAEHKETRRFVAAQLNFQVPNLQQRNYVGLLTAIQGISEQMVQGATYDQAFANRQAYINLGRQLTAQARDIILIKFRNSVQKTDGIRYLIQQVCGPDVSENCDNKVANAIRGNPRLQAQGNLLVELGVLAKYWNERAIAWVDAARQNRVEDYLTRNKNTLQPLFLQAVKVTRLEQEI